MQLNQTVVLKNVIALQCETAVYTTDYLHDRGRGGELLFEPTFSNTVFNAAALTIINLTLTTCDTQTPSRYDELIAAFQPLLCGIKIRNLRQDSTLQDLTFLSNEASVDPTNLQYLGIAHRLFD